MQDLSETEALALKYIEDGLEADLSYGEKNIDMTQASSWGPERTIRSGFIRWLCTDPDKVKKLALYGLRIRGAKINNEIELSTLNIPFIVSLHKCIIPFTLDLRRTSIRSLSLLGSITSRVEADLLKVDEDLWLSEGFLAEGPVSLMGAKIKGNLSCAKGQFKNQRDQHYFANMSGCFDCRATTLNLYSLVLDRAIIEGSLHLCGGFIAHGGVSLTDSIIGANVNCTNGIFNAKVSNAHQQSKTTGRRLACDSDHDYHSACAFNGEGLRVKGNLIMRSINVHGETRLTGASIGGDLDSTEGNYDAEGNDAIYGDRLRVTGNVFFCDKFFAKGIIRLARAKIGADLSFYEATLTNSNKNTLILNCEGMNVQGSVLMRNFTIERGYVELSYSTIGGNLDCTVGTFQNDGDYAIRAIGMNINGSVFLSSLDKQFRANSLVSLTGSKLGMDLICTNGEFESSKPCRLEYAAPVAINANNMSVLGKVEMNGEKFTAKGGVNLDYTSIGGSLLCTDGTFIAPDPNSGKSMGYAISGGKLSIGGSASFSRKFVARGCVMLNDASIGRNLNFTEGKIYKPDKLNNSELPEQYEYALWAVQMHIAGSIFFENFSAHGESRIDHSVIGVDLKCCGSQFVNKNEEIPETKLSGETRKYYALRANGVKIIGSAEFANGFNVDGIVSLQNVDIGMHFQWKGIKNKKAASLYLDQAHIGVLDDEASSWPEAGNLQINDFEYQFLMDLSRDGLVKRREEWLRLPSDFRTQPFEHLALVLKKNGYEEDAKAVLIQKNMVQTELPIRWHSDKSPSTEQSQSFSTWLIRRLFQHLICYGYKPSKAFLYGFILVLIGTVLFHFGFRSSLMIPTKDGSGLTYQVAEAERSQNQSTFKNDPLNIKNDYGLYSFIYSLDTFLPVIDFQAADFWLPTAHPKQQGSNWIISLENFGMLLCVYRWILILGGWVLTTFFLAALSGIVRK